MLETRIGLLAFLESFCNVEGLEKVLKWELVVLHVPRRSFNKEPEGKVGLTQSIPHQLKAVASLILYVQKYRNLEKCGLVKHRRHHYHLLLECTHMH